MDIICRCSPLEDKGKGASRGERSAGMGAQLKTARGTDRDGY